MIDRLGRHVSRPLLHAAVAVARALPLFLHGRLWGPFALTFVYQAINVVGWFQWVRDEHAVESRHELPQAAAA